jgi:hypothetical protein
MIGLLIAIGVLMSSSPDVVYVSADDLAGSSALRALIDDTRAHADALVVLSGGAKNMSDEHKQQLLTLLQGTLRQLSRTGLRFAVGDGGTQAGIMEAAGLARRASGNAFPLIGVSPAGEIKTADDANKPDTANKTPVDPNHSTIVAVTNNAWAATQAAKGKQATDGWGSETEAMYWLFARMAAGRHSVALVANGGAITLAEIRANVDADRPLLVIAGSGRAADAVISLLRNTSPDDAELKSLKDEAQRLGLPGKPTLFHIVDLQAPPDTLPKLLVSLLNPVP